MIQPSADVQKTLASIARTHPHFVEWLGQWRQQEVERLPYSSQTVVGVAQGRCQVLTELHKLVISTIDSAAQSRKG